jgi:PadR family transcriptional regulator PadR
MPRDDHRRNGWDWRNDERWTDSSHRDGDERPTDDGCREDRHREDRHREGRQGEGKYMEEEHRGGSHRDGKPKEHYGWHRHEHAENVVRPERFMEPCLLLLLTENVSYGYDLISRLKEFGFGDNQDPGMVYRYLRRLEKRGMIESKWDTTGTGPARRMYKVTADGNELLSVWTETIRLNIEVLQQFLVRYRKATQATGAQTESGDEDDHGDIEHKGSV